MSAPGPIVRSSAQYDLHNPQNPPASPMTPDQLEQITLPAALAFADQRRQGCVDKVKRIFACAIL